MEILVTSADNLLILSAQLRAVNLKRPKHERQIAPRRTFPYT